MDIHWTYREFTLEAGEDELKVVINSDDCVDFESIDVSEIDGRLEVQRVPRKKFDDSTYALPSR